VTYYYRINLILATKKQVNLTINRSVSGAVPAGIRLVKTSDSPDYYLCGEALAISLYPISSVLMEEHNRHQHRHCFHFCLHQYYYHIQQKSIQCY